jgi:hypothetical protein
MWKIIVAFIVFAALALFVIMKGGDKLDMGGEQHGSEATHAPEAPASAPAPAPAASAPEAPASTVAPGGMAK